MLRNLFTKKPVELKHSFNSKVILLSPVQVAQDGRVRMSNEFKPFDIVASLREFTIHDFSIGNLQSIGALSKLKTTYMAKMSDMNVADSFENFNFSPDVQGS